MQGTDYQGSPHCAATMGFSRLTRAPTVLHILSITAPIYLLIALGWFIVRQDLFDKAALRVMGRFVLQIALPALLFKALASFGPF